jgi:hypothetical protein
MNFGCGDGRETQAHGANKENELSFAHYRTVREKALALHGLQRLRGLKSSPTEAI